ncbi:MAG: RluA family pseudouridine synthase [Prevotella sp.]|nr:RluA family pseudouridine synthase [Prevotella sp.]
MMHPLQTDVQKPERFTYPFCYEPHPLCRQAAQEVQQYIAAHDEIRQDADSGKMFGVLVVERDGQLGFVAAYSGLLAGRNDWPYFVPPVYDAQQPDGYFKTKEREISELVASSEGGRLVGAKMSQDLQLWLFHQYQLLNARGETRDLVDLWQSYYSRPKLQRRYPLPPGGTGDCCAPKLLQYAYRQGLRPVCMAEFWWGAPTKTELRRHLNYYPACRGKCKPILTWMLQGLDVDPDPESLGFEHKELPVVYEDDYLLVVDKPSGMLSIPGRIEDYSVETVMRQRYPEAVVAHRLDMGTSGLLIVAKTLDVYRPLQEQFVRHEVRKKYLAVLDSPQPSAPIRPQKGTIDLPLRRDPMNRPRQMVDREHGKRAVTYYEMLTDCLVALYPQTGRTHQLRIHCAHPDGLARPIVGDELYGTRGGRLMLHAAEIWFSHPVTQQPMHFELPFPHDNIGAPNNK